MPMTRDEYAQAVKVAVSRPDTRRTLMPMLRDAVAAELLVGDERWDTFLEWCAGALREVQAARQIAERILLDPRTVTHDELMRAKLVHADLEGQVKALTWVMKAPQGLKAGAAEIRELLGEKPDARPA